MSRLKVMTLSIVVVLAVAAVASASASAAQREFKIAGAVLAGTETVSGTGGAQTLAIEGVVTIECKSANFSGTIEAGGKSSAGKLVYKTCATVGATKCKVTEAEEKEITASFTDKLNLTTEALVEDVFTGSGANETFTEITLTGAECALKGTNKVKGTQTCKIDKTLAEAQKEAVKHEVICVAAGSNLKVGALKATYVGNAVTELSGGKKGSNWSST